MSDTDQPGGDWGAEGPNAEMPWTDSRMPCVYCGRLLPRDSKRCPECKTSYSLAVRRASREVEGPWFYLEQRNPSNRGVDTATMLKLIEKGRLKRSSVVRGPTTKQDWMYAAEAPLISKHLGVCPHCFGPASGAQEFCDNCHRSLDERPARLRPGVSQPGAESQFPQREATEASLAEALKTHDMARVASQMVLVEEEPSPLHDILGRESSDVAPTAATPTPRRPRPKRFGDRHPKPHIVVLLTIVTVIPLGLLMMFVPLPGENTRRNQQAVRQWLAGLFGAGSSEPEPPAPGQDPTILQRIEDAHAAAQSGEYNRALAIYDDLIRTHPGTDLADQLLDERAEVQNHINRKTESARVLDKLRKVQQTYEAGKHVEAKSLLATLTIDERGIATHAGFDVRALEVKIIAALQVEEERRQQKLRRQAVRNLLAKAGRELHNKDFDGALATYQEIANKYPAEDLPNDVDLAALIEQARSRKVGPPPPPPPPPEQADKVKADSLWAEAKRLEGRREFRKAIKKCQDILALPAKVHPEGLRAQIEALEKKAKDKEKWDFFFGGGAGSSALPPPDSEAPRA